MFNTKTIKEVKWELTKYRWKKIAASMTQFLNTFRRLDAGSSVMVILGFTTIIIHSIA